MNAISEELDASGSRPPSAALLQRLLEDDGLLHRWTTASGPVDEHGLVRLLTTITSDAPHDALARARRILSGDSKPEDHEVIVPGAPRMFVFALTDGLLVGNWRPRELASATQVHAVLDVGRTIARTLGCDASLQDEGETRFAVLRAAGEHRR